MGLTVISRIFSDIPHIKSKCGECKGIFMGILSMPHNTLMDLNNVMKYYTRMESLYPTCVQLQVSCRLLHLSMVGSI